MPAIVPFFCAGLFGEEVTDDMSVQLPPSITKFQKEHDGFNRQASQHDVGAGRPLKKPTTSSDANAASSWVHELQVLCIGRPRPRPRPPRLVARARSRMSQRKAASRIAEWLQPRCSARTDGRALDATSHARRNGHLSDRGFEPS